MDGREFKGSRMRNWLALLLMAVAAIAAGRTHAQGNDEYRESAAATRVR
jgi:hypothetical protein